MNKSLDRDLLEVLIYVCIGIGEQSYHTPVGKNITYKTDSKIVPRKYTPDGRIREAIYFLQNEGAIRVIKEHVRPWKHSDEYVSWEIEAIKDKFKDVEAKIQKMFDVFELRGPEQKTIVNGSSEAPIKPAGWGLTGDEVSAYITHNGKKVYTFSNSWSAKYKYFKCIWDNYGERVGYEKLYHLYYEKEYPKKGITKINRNIRSIVNKLKKDSKFNKLPVKIKTSKGFILTISD